MATLTLNTDRTRLSIRFGRPAEPALPSNVFSLGQARVTRETPTYLTGRI